MLLEPRGFILVRSTHKPLSMYNVQRFPTVTKRDPVSDPFLFGPSERLSRASREIKHKLCKVHESRALCTGARSIKSVPYARAIHV